MPRRRQPGRPARAGRPGSSPRAAADLLAKLARAVQAAHDQGIVHRDLKPGQHPLRRARASPRSPTSAWPSGRRRARPDPDPGGDGHAGLHGPRAGPGRTKFVGPAADVYALGVILYECLAGAGPVRRRDSLVLLLDGSSSEEPRPPEAARPGPAPRPGGDLPEVPGRRTRPTATRARRAGGGPAAVPGRRADPGPAGRALARMAWLWCRRNPLPAALAARCSCLALRRLARPSAGPGARPTRERSEKALIADYLSDRVLAESSTEVNPRGARFTVRELLDRVGSRIGGDFQGHPEVEASIRETVGKSYLSLGEYARAEAHLRAAIGARRRLRGPGDPAALRVANLLAVLLDAVRPARRGRGPAPREPRRLPAARSARTTRSPSRRRPGSGPCSGPPASWTRPSPCSGRPSRPAAASSRRTTPTPSGRSATSACWRSTAGGSTRPRRWPTNTSGGSAAPGAPSTPTTWRPWPTSA